MSTATIPTVGYFAESRIFIDMTSSPIVAIQGEALSFHDVAARHFFPTIKGRCYKSSFEGVFQSVSRGDADYGVSAIENSFAGSINQVYDLLREHKLSIIGEVYEKIELCLIAHPNVLMKDITEVYSHPVALAQAKQYLDENLKKSKRLEHDDTAGSVAFIKQSNNQSAAAIANAAAAEFHHMNILARGIEANQNTYTRFVVVAKESSEAEKTNKTSLVLTTSHKPGALYSALAAFADNQLNLLKLQSRPIPQEPWQYMFYIDVAAGAREPALKKTLNELNKQDCQYEILGSYQKGQQFN